jgi:hypothetical protein
VISDAVKQVTLKDNTIEESGAVSVLLIRFSVDRDK